MMVGKSVRLGRGGFENSNAPERGDGLKIRDFGGRP